MSPRRLEAMSREELVRELEKLETVENRLRTVAAEPDRELLIRDLQTHQIELEMQNRELREAQERLEESRQRYSDLYDFAPAGYCTLDRRGHLQEMNLVAAEMLGGIRDELVGRPFSGVAPLRDGRPLHEHLERCFERKERVSFELTLLLGPRGTRTVRVVGHPVEDGQGAVVACRTVLIDVSETKRLEEQLRLLSRAGEALTASLDYSTTLEAVARVAMPALADLCILDVVAEAGRLERKVVLFADPRKQEVLEDRLRQAAPRPGWQSPQARAIDTGEPMLLEAAGDQPPAAAAPADAQAEALREAGVRSLMVVPLCARGRTLGALTLATAGSERRYASPDLHLAEDLASRAALAIDNARLHASVERANDELRVSEARATGIVSVSPDAIISVDEGQRITRFNRGAEQIFGWKAEEVVGDPLDALIPERLREAHRRQVEQFAAGEQTSRYMGGRSMPIHGLRRSGEEFPADAAISKLEAGGRRILTVALRDITWQKQVEKEERFLAEVGLALAASAQDYEATLSRVGELAVRELADVCILDLVEAGGRLRRQKLTCRDPAKAALCQALLEVPSASGRGSLISAALESRRPVLMQSMSPELVAALAQSEEHLELLRAIDPRSLIAVPLLSRGKLLGAIALVSSAPSRVYGPADLHLAEELAQRAALSIENASLYLAVERAVQARDEVLGIVAHDLRNPLEALLLQARLLQRLHQDRRSEKALGLIERSARRMGRLVQDLLDMASIEAGHLSMKRAPVEAEEVLKDALEAQRSLAEAGSVKLRLDADADLSQVQADRDRLLQVFENLIGNALQFTPPGGRVTAGVSMRGGEMVFRVEDTGAGISSEDLPHVFDRFWQAQKSSRRGAGLGLAIVKSIVDAHGGRAWVESRVGAGSTFFFTVPAVPSEPNEAVAPRPAPPQRHVVLVAEDDPDARETLQAVFDKQGYEVIAVSNGEEALAHLRRPGPPPTVVVLDLAMPVMDGWAFLAEKNRDPALRPLPVIVISAQKGVADRVTATGARYVEKPYRVDHLLEVVEKASH